MHERLLRTYFMNASYLFVREKKAERTEIIHNAVEKLCNPQYQIEMQEETRKELDNGEGGRA